MPFSASSLWIFSVNVFFSGFYKSRTLSVYIVYRHVVLCIYTLYIHLQHRATKLTAKQAEATNRNIYSYGLVPTYVLSWGSNIWTRCAVHEDFCLNLLELFASVIVRCTKRCFCLQAHHGGITSDCHLLWINGVLVLCLLHYHCSMKQTGITALVNYDILQPLFSHLSV